MYFGEDTARIRIAVDQKKMTEEGFALLVAGINGMLPDGAVVEYAINGTDEWATV